MTRELHPDTRDELSKETLAPIIMAEMDFASGWVRFWSGIGTLNWNGVSWHGSGHFGKISPVEETVEVRAVGMQLMLSGLPVDLTTEDGRTLPQVLLDEDWQGRTARVYFAVLRRDRSFVGQPVQLFGGFMDQCRLGDNAIILSCESALFDLERTKARRWTPQDQRAEFPGDAFCDPVPALQELEISWGRP